MSSDEHASTNVSKDAFIRNSEFLLWRCFRRVRVNNTIVGHFTLTAFHVVTAAANVNYR